MRCVGPSGLSPRYLISRWLGELHGRSSGGSPGERWHRTSNGDRDISVPNAPSGQYHLDLTTSNGDITAKSAG